MPYSTRALMSTAAALISVAALAGCSGSGGLASSPVQRQTPTAARAAVQLPLTAQVVTQDLAIGPSRLSLGLLDGANHPVPDARVHLELYRLVGSQGTLSQEMDATFIAPGREAGLPEAITATDEHGRAHVQANIPRDVGVYVVRPNFDTAGPWGVQAKVTLPDGRTTAAQTTFEVQERSAMPAVGAPAPASANPTWRDVPDLRMIDSSAQPSKDLHERSVKDALAEHKPVVVLVATPGYCQSRFCGPELEIERRLEQQYRGQASFVHIEIWRDPVKQIPWDTVTEWHVTTEPYFFVVDRGGIIAAKFEGPTSIAELDSAMQRVLNQ